MGPKRSGLQSLPVFLSPFESECAHAMPPNLGQAANIAVTNSLALAARVTEGNDVSAALQEWESRHRPLTDHVKWFSYIYDLALGKWPNRFIGFRTGVIQTLTRTKWFERALRKGA